MIHRSLIFPVHLQSIYSALTILGLVAIDQISYLNLHAIYTYMSLIQHYIPLAIYHQPCPPHC